MGGVLHSVRARTLIRSRLFCFCSDSSMAEMSYPQRHHGSVSYERMSVCMISHKQLFLDLEALSEEQIEVGLKSGVWGDPARPAVERYLAQLKMARVEAAAAEQLASARDAINEARAMKVWAMSALIIAGGAMLAAMASAFIAFLALGKGTISW